MTLTKLQFLAHPVYLHRDSSERFFSLLPTESLADLQKLMRKGIVINEVTAYFRFEITSDFLHMTLNSYQGQNGSLVFST